VVLDDFLTIGFLLIKAQLLKAWKDPFSLEESDKHEDQRIGIQFAATHSCEGFLVPELKD